MIHRRQLLALGAGTAFASGFASGFPTIQEDEQATPGFFIAPLTSVRQSVGVDSGGGAMFSRDRNGDQIHYAVLLNNVENVGAAKVRRGSPGEGGPVVAWLYPDPNARSAQTISGRFDGVLAEGGITPRDLVGPLEGESMDAFISLVADGNAHVQVVADQQSNNVRGPVVTLERVVQRLAEDAGGTTQTPGNATDTATGDQG